jgi:degradative hydroxymethylglutaryl-CoA reductase
MSSIWSGFYSKSLEERQQQLELVFPDLSLLQLEEHQANNMIENCIGIGTMPLGLGLNFRINDSDVVVPMQIEEPSVVAAVSGAAKLISQHGGFHCTPPQKNIVYAQVQLLDISDERIDDIVALLISKNQEIVLLANEFCQSMFTRGGGVTSIDVRKIKRSKPGVFNYWLVVHFLIDTCDAMGANCASSVAEGMAPYLSSLTDARIGFRIVSNLSLERVTTAKFQIPVEKLEYKGYSGQDVAHRIVEAYEWACDDVYRAVTHNKGIMNGIDAVAIATGQDWRAIEAAAHCWASFDNYKPLTKYEFKTINGIDHLVGTLSLPISVGTKGGVLNTNPLYRYSLGLMGHPDAKSLAMVHPN